jgi:hypothetical protein
MTGSLRKFLIDNPKIPWAIIIALKFMKVYTKKFIILISRDARLPNTTRKTIDVTGGKPIAALHSCFK